MRTRLAVMVVAVVTSPAFADKKIDPDPAFLIKARSAATATVEAHYDLVSDKVPFWARFVVCAGQLTAARDEGRALPTARADIDRLIADYRGRAVELLAHRAKVDAKAKPLEADTEIAKVRAGAMEFLPGDTTRIGTDRMKMRHGERLAFCHLTRDWYEVQNGLRPPASPADQQKFAAIEAAERAKERAQRPALTSVVPPLRPASAPPSSQPPVLAPKPVQPIAAAPAPTPAPAARVAVPPAGTPVGGENARDVRVGSDISHAGARTDFAGRPLWSAIAECVARMELIQARTGDSTRVQQEGYARRAAYILWGSRGDVGGKDLGAMAGPVSQERARLGQRVAATWDEHRQRTGAIPNAHWGQVCAGLEDYAARQAEAMKKFNAATPTTSSTSSSASGYGGYTGPTNSGAADHARSMNEHRQTMQRYERENQQIRNEIRAIDRKYGR